MGGMLCDYTLRVTGMLCDYTLRVTSKLIGHGCVLLCCYSGDYSSRKGSLNSTTHLNGSDLLIVCLQAASCRLAACFLDWAFEISLHLLIMTPSPHNCCRAPYHFPPTQKSRVKVQHVHKFHRHHQPQQTQENTTSTMASPTCADLLCARAPSSPPSPTPTLLLCSRCRTARYCFQACQATSWPSHKASCARQNYVIKFHLAPGDIAHPAVVRTLSCPAGASFYALHEALRVAFGWASEHSLVGRCGQGPGVCDGCRPAADAAAADDEIWTSTPVRAGSAGRWATTTRVCRASICCGWWIRWTGWREGSIACMRAGRGIRGRWRRRRRSGRCGSCLITRSISVGSISTGISFRVLGKPIVDADGNR